MKPKREKSEYIAAERACLEETTQSDGLSEPQ